MYDSIVSSLLVVLGGSGFTWAFTALAKAIPSIPVERGQDGRIALVKAVAGTFAGLIAMYCSSGYVTGDALQSAATVLFTAATSYVGSHYIHKGIDSFHASKLIPPPDAPT